MSDNIIQLSKPCTLCENRQNVQLFAGLMLCGSCQENIRLTNPSMFCKRPLNPTFSNSLIPR
ncbi:TPA: hypothetical protein ACNU7O_003648 [Acinetobacter baumannii]